MKFDPDKPFKSDGCSWFPDLWMRECCRSHDYAYWAGYDRDQSDLDFLRCVADSSRPRLGAFSYLFAGVIVTGMAIGRPIRDLVLAWQLRRRAK